MIEIAYPAALLLLPAPLLVAWLAPPYEPPRTALRVPFLVRLEALTGQVGNAAHRDAGRGLFCHALRWFGWAAVVLACARPQWIEPPISRTVASRDLLIAVDLSGSMETRDFTDPDGQPVDRLTAVKTVLDDFFARREGDRVGLLVFGNAPFVLVPFTEDLSACRALVNEMTPRMAGPQTMLGDAIGKAIAVFESSDLGEQVLILLTDGNDTGSLVPPASAATIARDRGVTIHVIGMGDPATAGETPLDEVTLRNIADTTGGRFFRAQDRASLAEIYAELDRLSTREHETVTYRPVVDVFHWPLAAAVLLILIVVGVPAARQLSEFRRQGALR